MSAWGISNFENDTALDWVSSIVEQKGGSQFKSSIDSFATIFKSNETTLVECSRFLAMAEVVAGLVGNPAEDFPEELMDWIELKYINLDKSIIEKTIKGVNHILFDSEAKEMYLDSGYFNSWEKTQKNLIQRLKK
jgi:hypothetical protein